MFGLEMPSGQQIIIYTLLGLIISALILSYVVMIYQDLKLWIQKKEIDKQNMFFYIWDILSMLFPFKK
jgi:hypothetical protein